MKRWQRTIAYLVTLCVILTGTLLAGRVLSDKGKESETFSAYSSVQGF